MPPTSDSRWFVGRKPRTPLRIATGSRQIRQVRGDDKTGGTGAAGLVETVK